MTSSGVLSPIVPHSSRPPVRVGIALIMFVAAGVLAFFAGDSTRLDTQTVFGSLALAIFFIGLLVLLFSSLPWFGLLEMKLGAWFVGYSVLSFGLATITAIQPSSGTFAVVQLSEVPRAILLVGISFVLWAVGYVFGQLPVFRIPMVGLKRLVTTGRSTVLRSRRALIVCFGVGVLGDVVTALLTGQFGYLGQVDLSSITTSAWYVQPLDIVSSLKYAALFGLSARVFIKRIDRSPSVFLFVLCVALAMSLVSGLKETYILTLVAAGVPFLIGRGRRAIIWAAAAALVFVFVITPMVTGLREELNRSGNRVDLGAAMQLAVDNVVSGAFLSGSGDSSYSPAQSASERIRLIDNLAVIMERSPGQIPYRSLDEIWTAPFVGMIPRAVWPEKPIRLSGYDFYKQYYDGQGQSSSAITLEGSLYMYGGTLILMIGMFFVGFVLRVLDDSLMASRDLHGALLFVIMFHIVVKQELDVASFLAGLPVYLITWLIAIWGCFGPALPGTEAPKRAPRRAGLVDLTDRNNGRSTY